MKEFKISNSITTRDGVLGKYLQSINRLEMISPEEEVDLARKIHSGDAAALKRLVEANLRFVVSVAKQYQSQGLSLDDLISEGNIGLIKAARKYDETKGFKFISYAVWWIRQSILQALSEHSRAIRLPQNQVALLNKIRKESGKFLMENGREATTAELSAILDVPEKHITETLRASMSAESLDAPFSDDDDGSILDVKQNPDSPAADKGMDDESLGEDVERALGILSARDREVVKSLFGIGRPEMTMEEVGAKMDISRERVRQIRDLSLRKLRGQAVRSLLLKHIA